MQTRIYVVGNTTGEPARLVEATSQAQAIRHVVTDKYWAKVATAKDVAEGMRAGLTVEGATANTPEPHIAHPTTQTQTNGKTITQ